MDTIDILSRSEIPRGGRDDSYLGTGFFQRYCESQEKRSWRVPDKPRERVGEKKNFHVSGLEE